MTRYAIVGAGAVGGALGGTLARAGHAVTLVARGAHLDALRERGLELVTPDETCVVHAPVLADARALALSELDAIVIATKSQDTSAVLEALSEWQGPIVCAQNGVANERAASERFARVRDKECSPRRPRTGAGSARGRKGPERASRSVIGMLVFAPLSHLTPGTVTLHARAPFGGLDLGPWPAGQDDVARQMADDLRGAGWDARAVDDIARRKYGKLLTNLGNALEALGGRAALRGEDWLRRLTEEAEACLRAAGIAHASASEIYARFAEVREAVPRSGGSTWQSLARGVPLETDLLNGEIVRLGAAHDVPTPWNRALVALSARASREGWAAESLAPEELSSLLDPASSPAEM